MDETDDPPPAAAPPLDLATTDEIWAELSRRHGGAVMICLEKSKDAGSPLNPITVRVVGNDLTALGMCRYAETAISRMIFDRRPDDDEEDD